MKEVVFYIFPAFIMIVEYFILRSLYYEHIDHRKEYLKMSKSMHILYQFIVFVPIMNIFGVIVMTYPLFKYIVIEDFKSDLFWTEEK